MPDRGERGRRPGVLVHRSRRLPRHEITVCARLPVTTPSRTLLDLADVLDPHSLQRALEQAELLRLFDKRALDQTLQDNPGRQGATRLRQALAELATSSPPTRSALEDAFLELCARHSLPRPLVNQRVLEFEVDFVWPQRRVIVEADGFAHHGSRSAFEQDRWRDLKLEVAGYKVLRCTWRQLQCKPAEVANMLKAVLNTSGLKA